jgi:hypothetical protein
LPIAAARASWSTSVATREQEAPLVTLEAKNIDRPDQQRSFEHGDVRLVELPGATIARAEFQPGWRWSTDVKPAAGTDSCQLHHISYVSQAASTFAWTTAASSSSDRGMPTSSALGTTPGSSAISPA